ncbi:DUF6251 family protein [Streptomyces paromomycinus]|uniref:Uncharacterized protein n=1 Tax=Streptomyces paromomycinus TaxID=92743 RepID=A0A401W8S4_STREY|nr:DUF6251 family protein [Streptomyces paromomycinus]GCD45714.1 hypothetical protein GKJPGBOP_05452 [Streptomyces paromomycinus]
MSPPRRFQFDNQLPVPRAGHGEVVYRPEPLPTADTGGPRVIVQHIHQAPPDRTVQRVALGAGAGAGAVAAGVCFGPLLATAAVSVATILVIGGLIVAVGVWGVVSVVRAVSPPAPDGKPAARR